MATRATTRWTKAFALVAAALAFAGAQPAAASSADAHPNQQYLDQCISKMATAYRVPLTLAQAVHAREGGKLGKTSKPNRNGTRDLGPLQINSQHLPFFAARGITEQLLLDDPCVNAAAGAWFLRTNFDNADANWREALCLYNTGLRCSKTSVGRAYADDVLARERRIQARSASTSVAQHN